MTGPTGGTSRDRSASDPGTDGGVEHDPAPPRRSVVLSVGIGALSVAFAGATPGPDLLAGIAGVAGLVAGLLTRSRRAVWIGGGLLAVAAIVDGAVGGSVAGSLLAGTTALIAWDVGDNAVELGRQVGRSGRTARAEYVHAGAGAVVGFATALVGYVVFLSAAGGRPVVALALLLLGAIVLVERVR